MIYIAFAFWLFALVFAARCTMKLWAQMITPKALSWAVLPGTLATELAFYLGSLLSGADFRPRKLVDDSEDTQKDAANGPASGGVPYLTPVLTGLMPVLACMSLIFVLSTELGHPVFRHFYMADVEVPVRLPGVDGETLWGLLAGQVKLMENAWAALTDSLANMPWQNPKGWIFQYLMICLIVRMAPTRRPMRPALVGTAVVAFLIAATVAVVSSHGQWLRDVWPLLSYTWATALLLLAVTLCIRGGVSLYRIVLNNE